MYRFLTMCTIQFFIRIFATLESVYILCRIGVKISFEMAITKKGANKKHHKTSLQKRLLSKKQTDEINKH